MLTQVTFNFTIGHYQGTMGMTIRDGEKILLEKQTFETDKFSFTTYVSWPCVLEIQVTNKGKFDTMVGPDGKILQDKYIKLETLEVDRMQLHIVPLLDMMDFCTEDGERIKSNYWGFNGTSKINLYGSDSFFWHLGKLQKLPNNNKNIESVWTEHQDNAGLGTIY